MAKVIQWKHGTTEEHESYTGTEREITIDDDLHTIRVHGGATAGYAMAAPDVGEVEVIDPSATVGSTRLALLDDVPTKLSQLTDDVGVWRADELVNLSQLINDAGFWKKTDLTKISQLTNDSGFLTGHCSYCTYCTYCSQCSNCHNCTTVQCTTVNCTTVQCNTVQCTSSNCNCSNDCTDDGCLISGELLTQRGLVECYGILVGDQLIDKDGKFNRVVGVSHNRLGNRRAIYLNGAVVTAEHPILVCGKASVHPEYAALTLKGVAADNGKAGRYGDVFTPQNFMTAELPEDTPTVCPICEKTCVVKFGAKFILIPGVLNGD